MWNPAPTQQGSPGHCRTHVRTHADCVGAGFDRGLPLPRSRHPDAGCRPVPGSVGAGFHPALRSDWPRPARRLALTRPRHALLGTDSCCFRLRSPAGRAGWNPAPHKQGWPGHWVAYSHLVRAGFHPARRLTRRHLRPFMAANGRLSAFRRYRKAQGRRVPAGCHGFGRNDEITQALDQLLRATRKSEDGRQGAREGPSPRLTSACYPMWCSARTSATAGRRLLRRRLPAAAHRHYDRRPPVGDGDHGFVRCGLGRRGHEHSTDRTRAHPGAGRPVRVPRAGERSGRAGGRGAVRHRHLRAPRSPPRRRPCSRAPREPEPAAVQDTSFATGIYDPPPLPLPPKNAGPCSRAPRSPAAPAWASLSPTSTIPSRAVEEPEPVEAFLAVAPEPEGPEPEPVPDARRPGVELAVERHAPRPQPPTALDRTENGRQGDEEHDEPDAFPDMPLLTSTSMSYRHGYAPTPKENAATPTPRSRPTPSRRPRTSTPRSNRLQRRT